MCEKLLFTLKKTAVLSRLGLALEACGEGFQGHRPEVFAAARAHGYRFSLHFLVPDHHLVGELLQAMFADFIRNFLVSQIRGHPKPLF